ncbi:MAG: type II secretion system secretin GspD [Burkholderiaceae bacterium]|nr:type II secretion system secretin GspD [Burkholderiaceae bacterium]
MISYRYALSAVALAVCQLTAAQTPSDAPVVPTAPLSSAVLLTTTGPAAVAPVSGSSNITTATPDPVATEPRILRGTDRVIAPAKAPLGFDGPSVTFNFEEAPVPEVVRTILGDVLKVDYVLHPPLSGSVTLSTRMPVAPDQAAFLLESALQANGLALARDARGTYHVGRPDLLKGIGAAVRQTGNGPLPPGSGVVIVPLQYIGAGEMAAILRPLMSAEGLVRVDTVRNLLVLAGTRTQAEGWLDLVNTFDVDLLKGMSVGVFPLKYASIKEVEAALQLMSVGAGGAALPAPAPAAPAAPGASAAPRASAALSESNPLFGALRIMPIERLNSILVVTPRASYLDEARRWIERLDRPSDNSAEAQLFVYPVQNGNARHLASVLGGIFGDGKQAPTANNGVAPGLTPVTTATNFLGGSNNSGGLGIRAPGATAQAGAATNRTTPTSTPTVAMLGNIRVMADEINNAVLVWGSRMEYAKIEATLKRLDLPPTQVLIEASIIEVTLTDELKYGLQWAFNDSNTSINGTNYSGRGTLSNTAGGVLGGQAAGFSYTLRNPLGQVRAVLNALADKSLVKVISSPSLMVLDNHTAAINVGNQQPVKSGETVSTEGTVRSTNIQYKDTGVNLTVTPSVNAGNIVTMQVDQTVTDVGAVDEATGQRAFLQRQIASKVAVRSGESLVLGGLIRDNLTSGKVGVPVLQDIPVFGNLFGTNTTNGNRTELLVVITPRVVRSDQEMREVGRDLRDRMRGLQDVRIQEVGYRSSEPAAALSSPPIQSFQSR